MFVASALSVAFLAGCGDDVQKKMFEAISKKEEEKAVASKPLQAYALTVFSMKYDLAGALTGQTMTRYRNNIVFKSTAFNISSFPQLISVINTMGAPIVDANILNIKSSGGSGKDGIWFSGDDADQSYTLNQFDARGVLLRTDKYNDFEGKNLLKYAIYTMNTDGSISRVDSYRGDDVIKGSIRFLYEKGLLCVIEGYGADGKSIVGDIVISYDSLNRNTLIVARKVSSSKLKNNMRLVKTYSGNSLMPDSVNMQSWTGRSWETVYTSVNTLDPAGARVNKMLVTDGSGGPVNEKDIDYCTTFQYNNNNLHVRESMFSGNEKNLKGYTTYYYISQ